MRNLYDYIRLFDVSKLIAVEVSQCLLYLHQFTKRSACTDCHQTIERLRARLGELRKERC